MSAREQIDPVSPEDGGNSSNHQQCGMPGLTQSSTYVRPRTRQRVHKQPPPLSVPNINEDASERKRVLNVLAQRRYRERKRQSRGAAAPPASQGQTITPPAQTTPPRPEQAEFESQVGGNPAADESAATAAADFPDLDFSSLDADPSSATWAFPAPDVTTLLMGSALDYYGTPAPSTADAAGSSTIDPSALSSSGAGDGSFADSYLLSVPELTLLRAFLRIATRLGMATTLFWDLAATSPFMDAASEASAATHLLPAGWRPTAAQRLVAHHPLLDLLPWPTVRDRLIGIFDLPEPARPAAARGPLGLAQLAYDLEDTAEGLRIYGDDPCEPASWEVGQVVFERWWFVFDRHVLAQSNRWREMRGAAKLRIGSVVGEL